MAKLNIDTDYVAQLAELLQRTGLTEIEISEGDARVRVVKKPAPIYEAHVADRPAASQPANAAQSVVTPAAVGSTPPGHGQLAHGRHRLSLPRARRRSFRQRRARR